jgi:hypothetical protein
MTTATTTPFTARARAIWCSLISPTLAAAFETYLEKDVAEILEICESALVRDLAFEFEDAGRQLVQKVFAHARDGDG